MFTPEQLLIGLAVVLFIAWVFFRLASICLKDSFSRDDYDGRSDKKITYKS